MWRSHNVDYYTLLHDIFYYGKSVEQHSIKELIDMKLLADCSMIGNFYCTKKERPYDVVYKYLFGELCWYFSGEFHVKNIVKYSKFWDSLKDSSGFVNSNYGYMIFYKEHFDLAKTYTPFSWAREQLERNKFSKRAIMFYSGGQYYLSVTKDFPCTTNQQFFIRDNELISIVTIRSSDAIFGLTYDIPWWSVAQQQLYMCLLKKYGDLKLGKLTVNIASSHIYKKHYLLVEKMLKDDFRRFKILLKDEIPLGKDFVWYEKNIENYLEIKEI